MNFKIAAAFAALALALHAKSLDKVNTESGPVKGAVSADGTVRMFKGIPYAASPVGALRWKAPQPVARWTAVREANAFGPRCMQGNIFGDMVFRDAGPSEDCLYLNVWSPVSEGKKQPLLPVMVWIYGGGFAAGASSEPRQDGEMLAKKGVVVVSMNYRLNIFGFLAHPGLAKETGGKVRATTACSIRSPRSNGFTRTSKRLAAIPQTSPSSANRQDRSP